MDPETDGVLDAVGPRLRALRRERGITLALVGAPRTGDPRVHLKPIKRFGMILVPLSPTAARSSCSSCSAERG